MSINTIFSEFMHAYGGENSHVVVAASGGADSLALAFLAHSWACENKARLTVLTVNHGLRSDSKDEAEHVKLWLQRHEIDHHILTWNGEKPISSLQAKARDARYKLLVEWCSHNDGDVLMTAHHQDDQEETLLIRFLAGSGLDGLQGIKPVSRRYAVPLLRPLLTVKSSQLKDYLCAQNQPWIEDPSNENKDFQRVRVRHFLKEETEHRLLSVVGKFQDDADFINAEVDAFLMKRSTFHEAGYVEIKADSFKTIHPSLAFRVLNRVIAWLAPRPYPLRRETLRLLLEALQKDSFSPRTVGECYFMLRKGHIHVQRELDSLPDCVEKEVWDKRFYLKENDFSYTVQPLGKESIPPLKKIIRDGNQIPTVVWPTLPALWEKGRVVAVPHLGYSDETYSNVDGVFTLIPSLKSIADKTNES